MNYFLHILIIINIYIILTVSTNLIVGLANLLSIGQAAFYGIGAYISTYALMSLGFSLIPSLLLAILVNALFGLLLGIITIKLKDDYFILATLGFQIIVFSILYNWLDVTRGPYGIPGIPMPKLFGLIKISNITSFLILSTVLSGFTVFFFHRLINSPYGRALKALRDDTIAMIILGRNTNLIKIKAFVISSAFIAISGFIYCSYISYIDPTSFNLDESIFIISAVLIGGTGNIKGPIAGAVFVIALPEALRFVGMPDTIAANLRMIIYGLSLIIFMFYRKQGIAGDYEI